MEGPGKKPVAAPGHSERVEGPSIFPLSTHHYKNIIFALMKSKILNVRASSLSHFAFERWRIPALPIEQSAT
jgi:hypothetical protein